MVLVLLGAAFAAGWVARGDDPRGEAPAAEPDDDDARLHTARTAYLAAVDAWLDGLSPESTLTVFDAARAAVTAPPEAMAALDDAGEVLGRFRAGHPMTAADSARLEEVEERLGLADGTRRHGGSHGGLS